MNTKPILQKSYPCLVAIIVFIAIAFFYCSPVFQGKVIQQSDVMTAMGMQHEMNQYHEQTGKYTLWTNSMFGGMPTYQIGKAGVPNYNIFYPLSRILRLHLPNFSVDIIFLYLIGFFILLLVLGINPWLSIVGAIAFAFSSYNFIIIIAGHVNKALSIGLIPMVLAGFILVYQRKYILGAILSIISFGIHLYFNHIQMTYYLTMILFVLFVVYFIFAIKEKEIKKFLVSTAIIGGSYILAIVPNITALITTYEYSKDTIRGKSELTTNQSEKSTGLDKDYALSWSYDKMETFTLIIPNFKGGASGGKLSENSTMYKELISNGVPRNNAKEYIQQAPTYWGDQPFTVGPVYFGAIICFLFVFGLYLVEKKHKWWMVSVSLIAILLSWGRHFEWFTDLFFYYVPLYNKFRAVSSILIIPSVIFPLLAFLGIREITSGNISKKQLLIYLRNSFFIVGGIVLFFLLFGSILFNFTSPNDNQMRTSGYPAWLINAIISDRKSLFRMDALRSLVFITLAAGALWLYIKEQLKVSYFILALGILVLADMWTVDRRYLNNSDFQSKKRVQTMQPTNADLQILIDKDPDFRVFNVTVDPFADTHTSYFHKSIGGYHGAKLRRYKELIDRHLMKQNMAVFNMLNTKYFIVKGDNNEPVAHQNPYALGNAWFVANLKVVNNADEEIAALDNFNPSATAVIDKKFIEKLPALTSLQTDSLPQSARILLTSYEPNHLTYVSETPRELFAVFSEIYYNDTKGWNAYLDGEKKPHVRVNYVLRGMAIPAGKHTLEFKFEPHSFYFAQKIELYSSLVAGIILLSLIGLFCKQQLKPSVLNVK
jgi:hypothetical protein